jgi:hypothetical protein
MCLLKLSDVNKNFNRKTLILSQVVSCIQMGEEATLIDAW